MTQRSVVDQVAFAAGASAPMSSRSSESRSKLVPAISAAVALVLVVALIVLVTGRHHSPSNPGASQIGSNTNNTSAGSPNGNQGSTSTTTTTTLPAGEIPVDISAVASNPMASQVAITFSTYFGGINDKNFGQAYSAYSPTYQQNVPESGLASGDATTTDSNVNLVSITSTSDGSIAVDVDFSSQQAAANGPNGETCTDWSLVYKLVTNPGTTTAAPGGTTLTYFISAASQVGPGAVGCAG